MSLATWADVEEAVRERGWKREGREWRGPCPVTGSGRDTCWFAPGATAAVRAGCRACSGSGGGLDADGLKGHIEAVIGARSEDRPEPPPDHRRPRRHVPDPKLPGRIWDAAERLQPDDPGHRYLRDRLGVDPPLDAGSVRWAPAAAVRGFLRPALPARAAGCIVYRFAAPEEIETMAAQVEAVDAEGRRAPFKVAGKRPSVLGSDFGDGTRVFEARAGGDPLHVCEGPLDALADAGLAAAGIGPAAPDGRIVGTLGAGGWKPAAAPGTGPVVLVGQDDEAGVDAVLRLRKALGGRVREAVFSTDTSSSNLQRVREWTRKTDWVDVAQAEFEERDAVFTLRRGDLDG